VSASKILLSREVEPFTEEPAGDGDAGGTVDDSRLFFRVDPGAAGGAGAGNLLRKAAIRAAHEASVSNKRKAVDAELGTPDVGGLFRLGGGSVH
jgi:hypothetical protein